jgi:hypothetical protein
MAKKVVIEGLRHRGDVLWFEYHCWESPSSSDAELWYRSHRKVTVLNVASNDAYDPRHPGRTIKGGLITMRDRGEAGLPIVYRVKFADGFVADATEDELLDSPKEYERPAPPKRPRS